MLTVAKIDPGTYSIAIQKEYPVVHPPTLMTSMDSFGTFYFSHKGATHMQKANITL